MPTVVEVSGVAKRFGEIRAVAGVDFAVHEGEVFGLIGHNGAGKSTLIRMILGLLAPDAGAIRIDGQPIAGPGFRALRRRIAYLPENVVFYDNLSGYETLRFFAELKGADARQCQPLLHKVGLEGARHRPVRGYSKGMRQRLGLAQALLGSPRLVFLDEPTSGLDPGGIREFYDLLAELKAAGVTIVLSSHNLAEIQERVDRLGLMRLGQLQAIGTVPELRDRLKLPLRIHVQLRPGATPALEAVLAGIPGCSAHYQASQGFIHCDRSHKMVLLARLSAMPETVSDIHVHEPSLEDVFLGYAEG
jgi:Cu-processing system ATP-binding protein